MLTYLDADLFFFSSPQHIFTEMGDASIAIIEHRFSLLARHLEKYGRYNVGWLSFRRDTTGIACLTRWRNQCLEWCGDYLGSDRFADQKYLDDWTTVFSNVRVIRNIGANVAPWNIANYRVASSNGAVSVSGKPLVFFHFASLKEIRPWLYRMNMAGYYTFASKHIRQNIYAPYVRELKHFGMVGTIRNRAPGKKLLISSLPKRLKIMARDARSLIFFDYLVFFKNRFF
ncbi:MAG TPA: hypothetical protein DCS07_04685 [Bdellovibrionales bacterium]|nr:MAG: hypothetical protein A2Z97_00755 [Bdellovibrionales bacterium GWB1_52_6]HAR41916.1 hypothetical protein [Bdellovibrionales bacterium]